MAKNSKNLQRVSDMLDGTYQGKLQVGQYNPTEKTRKIGERWTDSDGKEWEQKDGYRASVKRTPSVGIFPQTCKDCGTNCGYGATKMDKDTHKRQQRCYYCQIDFEAMLKSRVIGKTNNKHFFWTRLMELQRWIAGRNELEAWIFERHEENKKLFDESVANAMANENVDFQIKKNT